MALPVRKRVNLIDPSTVMGQDAADVREEYDHSLIIENFIIHTPNCGVARTASECESSV